MIKLKENIKSKKNNQKNKMKMMKIILPLQLKQKLKNNCDLLKSFMKKKFYIK